VGYSNPLQQQQGAGREYGQAQGQSTLQATPQAYDPRQAQAPVSGVSDNRRREPGPMQQYGQQMGNHYGQAMQQYGLGSAQNQDMRQQAAMQYAQQQGGQQYRMGQQAASQYQPSIRQDAGQMGGTLGQSQVQSDWKPPQQAYDPRQAQAQPQGNQQDFAQAQRQQYMMAQQQAMQQQYRMPQRQFGWGQQPQMQQQQFNQGMQWGQQMPQYQQPMYQQQDQMAQQQMMQYQQAMAQQYRPQPRWR
jgi:hypothetical protein